MEQVHLKSVLLAVAFTLCVLLGASPTAAQPAAEPVKTTVTANGLVADPARPAEAKGRLPAITALGGSEGGMEAAMARDAKVMARHGYAVLQVAPTSTRPWPAEGPGPDSAGILQSAIDWLCAQPGVDPERIGIVGGSIGSEVALTVASRYPEIKVAVATMPSSVVWPGINYATPDPPSTFLSAASPCLTCPTGCLSPRSTSFTPRARQAWISTRTRLSRWSKSTAR